MANIVVIGAGLAELPAAYELRHLRALFGLKMFKPTTQPYQAAVNS